MKKNNKVVKIGLTILISSILYLLLCTNFYFDYKFFVKNESGKPFNLLIKVDQNILVDTLISETVFLPTFKAHLRGGFKKIELQVNGKIYEESIFLCKKQNGVINLVNDTNDQLQFYFFNYYGSIPICISST